MSCWSYLSIRPNGSQRLASLSKHRVMVYLVTLTSDAEQSALRLQARIYLLLNTLTDEENLLVTSSIIFSMWCWVYELTLCTCIHISLLLTLYKQKNLHLSANAFTLLLILTQTPPPQFFNFFKCTNISNIQQSGAVGEEFSKLFHLRAESGITLTIQNQTIDT